MDHGGDAVALCVKQKKEDGMASLVVDAKKNLLCQLNSRFRRLRGERASWLVAK